MQKEQTKQQKAPGTVILLCALALLLSAALRPGEAAAAGQRFTVSNQTVKDEATGLVWIRNANLADRALSWNDARELVRTLNQENLAGHADWKLPELNELEKLAAAVRGPGLANPAKAGHAVVEGLKNAGFLNVQAGDYWSATTSSMNYADALFINMAVGESSAGSKSLYRHVWLVRWDGISRAASPRITVSELTVNNKKTGLVWTRDANLAGRALSWDDACALVKTLNQENYAGYSDWRLPEFTMLKKLAAAARGTGPADPAQDAQAIVNGLSKAGFQNIQAGDYWSATTSWYNSMDALFVSMTTGRSSVGNKRLYRHVWLVRWDDFPPADTSKKRKTFGRGAHENKTKGGTYD